MDSAAYVHYDEKRQPRLHDYLFCLAGHALSTYPAVPHTASPSCSPDRLRRRPDSDDVSARSAALAVSAGEALHAAFHELEAG